MQFDVVETLAKIPIFSHIDQEALQYLSEQVSIKTFPKHAIIVSEGDETSAFYFILSGRTRAYLGNEEGKEITMALCKTGDYFGEYALLDDEPRSATVATEEKTVCGVLSKATFKNFLAAHPDANMDIMRALLGKIRSLTEEVKALALLDVYGRLARKLIELSVEQEDGLRVIAPKPTQQDLANMVGSSREMIAKINKELELGGYISISGKTLTIRKKLPSGW